MANDEKKLLKGAMETTRKLIELSEKKVELLRELEKCLAIKYLCPDAFDHGACRTMIKKKPGKDEFKSFHIFKKNGEEIIIADRDKLPTVIRESTITDTERRIIRRKELFEKTFFKKNHEREIANNSC
jgi:hypothetical protein